MTTRATVATARRFELELPAGRESALELRPGLATERKLEEYAGYANAHALDAVREQAAGLRGQRVLQLSAGLSGGAAAPYLASLVALLRDLGLDVDWLVLPDAPFIRGLLALAARGEPEGWTDQEHDRWRDYLERWAGAIPGDEYDVVVAHGLALCGLALYRQGRARWVWHADQDVSGTGPLVGAELRQALTHFDLLLAPSAAFIPAEVRAPRFRPARAAVDPLAPCNQPLAARAIGDRLSALGLDPARPYVAQFAPLHEAFGARTVLEAFGLASRQASGLQLVLVEPLSPPRGGPWREVEGLLGPLRQTANARVLPRDVALAPQELNALQQAATAVLQLAAPGPFLHHLLQAQWKERPLVITADQRLADQVGGSATSLMVAGAEEAADAILDLLYEPGLAAQLGQRAREHVSRHHLITGLVSDYLAALAAL